jgi:three-Cys-motif partner protein
MAVPKETIWDIEPHTQAKHEILTRYLDAWFPILASWNMKVLFIDGFAGPGTYKDGSPGSPLLAIDAARRRESYLRNSTVMFLFNESHKAGTTNSMRALRRSRTNCHRISTCTSSTASS